MNIKTAAGFCRRMGTGFRAGLDLLRLCERESSQGSPRHRDAMSQVAHQLANGDPLARAMLDVGKYFPPMMIQMVHVGEETGRLERTLLELAEHYDHRVAMRRMFVNGIAWPVLQLFAGIGVVGLMLLIIETLGSSFNPLGISFTQYSVLVVLFFVMIGLAIATIRFNWFGVHRIYPLVYQIPKVGSSLQTIALSRICWTLSLALDSGLDALRSIKMALRSTHNPHFSSRGEMAVETIKTGGTMTDAFRVTGVFPDEFLHAIEVAEMSGTDAESLDRLAKYYDEQAKQAVRVLVGVATGTIWAMVTLLLVFMILKMAMSIGGVYRDAAQPM